MAKSTTNKGWSKPTSKAAKKVKAAPKGNAKQTAAPNVQAKNTSQMARGHKRQAPEDSEEASSDEEPVLKTRSCKQAKQAEAEEEEEDNVEEEEDNMQEDEGERGTDTEINTGGVDEAEGQPEDHEHEVRDIS